jgi:hypothetical protein
MGGCLSSQAVVTVVRGARAGGRAALSCCCLAAELAGALPVGGCRARAAAESPPRQDVPRDLSTTHKRVLPPAPFAEGCRVRGAAAGAHAAALEPPATMPAPAPLPHPRRHARSTPQAFLPLPPKPQLLACTAARPGRYPLEWHPLVCAPGDGLLLAAAFEGVGGASAARHCAEHAGPALARALRRGLDPEAALRAMWRDLDASFLGGREPDAVKARIGAVGSAVLIEARRRLVFASRLGARGPVLGRTTGAFTSVRVEAAALASGAPHRCAAAGAQGGNARGARPALDKGARQCNQ